MPVPKLTMRPNRGRLEDTVKPISHRSVRGAGILALTFLAASASAALPSKSANTTLGGGSSGAIFNPGFYCPPAALDVCQAFDTYSASCQATLTPGCKTILRDRFKADMASAQAITGTGYSTIEPKTMKNGGLLTPAAFVPYDQAAITGGVTSDFSYGTVIHSSALDALGSDTLETLGRSARLDSFHPEWELASADGTKIATCEEFVWKKYYDYERFREAAATCKSDDECLYQLAVLPSTPGLGMPQLRSGDAARSNTAVQVRPFIGGPESGAVTAPEDRPKNEFFSIPLVQFAGRLALYADGATSLAISNAAPPPYHITDRFQWHEDMHAAHQSYALTHAEYEEMEPRRKAIVPLLQRFSDLKASLPATTVFAIMNPKSIVKCPPKKPPPAWPPSTGDGDPYTPMLPCSSGPTTYPADSAAGQLVVVADQIVELLVAEWKHTSPRTGLVDHGCLDPASTRCDWSPKMMREYLHLFQSEKEHDFQRCVQQTGNSFPSAYPPISDANRADWHGVETYLATAKDEIEKQTKDLPWRNDNSLGDQIGITKSIGDPKWFGANFDGGVDWSVSFKSADFGGATRICAAQGKAGGHLKADAHVLFAGLNIVDGEVSAHAGQGGDPQAYTNAHLRILESWIIGADPNRFTPVVEQAAAFNVASDPQSWKLADVQTTIFVPFPVTVGAGADLSLGWALHGSGSAPQGCSSEHPAFQLQGSFSPTAAVRARAWGAIGASWGPFGADAGVEGDVTLVQAGLPVQVTIGLSDKTLPSGAPGVFYPSLTLDTSTRLDLTLLSGEVKAFAEICEFVCFRKEVHLFGWDGIHFGADVFPPLHKSWALQAVQGAKQQKPAPSPGL